MENKNSFKVNIIISFSKIMALLLLISGTCLALAFKQMTPFSLVVPIIGGIILGKQYFDKDKILPIDSPHNSTNIY